MHTTYFDTEKEARLYADTVKHYNKGAKVSIELETDECVLAIIGHHVWAVTEE